MKDLNYYMALNYPVTIVQRDHGGFFATHPDLSGCMAQGRTVDEALANLRDSREVWTEARLEGGYDVPEPTSEEFSGRFSLRVSPSLHGRLAQVAAREGISQNQLITNILNEYVGGRDTLEALRHQVLALVIELAVSTARPQARVLADAGNKDEAWLAPESGTLIRSATTRVVM